MRVDDSFCGGFGGVSLVPGTRSRFLVPVPNPRPPRSGDFHGVSPVCREERFGTLVVSAGADCEEDSGASGESGVGVISSCVSCCKSDVRPSSSDAMSLSRKIRSLGP